MAMFATDGSASPFPLKAIAACCALGTGLLAVAATLSSSPAFLLVLLGSILLNYGTVFFYQWLTRLYSHNKPSSVEDEKEYLKHVLLNTSELDDKFNKKHTGSLDAWHTLAIGLASLFISATLATGISLIFYYALPHAVMLATVASMLFLPIIFVVYRAYRRGLQDVWKDIQKNYLNGQSKDNTPSARNTRAWIWGKNIFLVIGALGCLAGGLLMAAMIQEGTATTIQSFGMGLAAAAGPLSWFMFAMLFISVAAIMARSVLMFVRDSSLDKKIKLKNALFNRKAYLIDLKNDWSALNTKLKDAQGRGDTKKLNRIYRKKDRVYHRYVLFSKPWFQPLFTSITLLLTAICFLGMLAHMARSSQAGMEMFQKIHGVSEKIAFAIADACMWVSLAAESVFTMSNVGDTMIEEGIGTQTTHYDKRLYSQLSATEAVSCLAYPSSRIQHGIFDAALAANGASGHSSKTGYGFVDRVSEPGAIGAALNAAAERDPDTFCIQWDYEKEHTCLLTGKIPAEQPPKTSSPKQA